MPAFLSWLRWWLTVDSLVPTAAARSQVQTSPALLVSRSDISLMRAGSASAFRRRATSIAASSVSGAAETGAQQIGAVRSSVGRALGMNPSSHCLDICQKGAHSGRGNSMYVSQVEVAMSRVQLALNVDDLDQAIAFYSKLFNTAPAKVKAGYANFAIAEPLLKFVLVENPGQGGTINHGGGEVASSATVHEEIARLTGEAGDLLVHRGTGGHLPPAVVDGAALPRVLHQHQLQRRLGDGEVRVPLLDLRGRSVEELRVERDGLIQIINVEGELNTGHSNLHL